jgi:metal-responsive CopG/Arc/MetJ family transcriptional regulator
MDMRTLVDLREEQVKGLDKVANVEGISRAEAIRRAVEQYLHVKSTAKKSAFGLLKGREIDGLQLQRESRQDR